LHLAAAKPKLIAEIRASESLSSQEWIRAQVSGPIRHKTVDPYAIQPLHQKATPKKEAACKRFTVVHHQRSVRKYQQEPFATTPQCANKCTQGGSGKSLLEAVHRKPSQSGSNMPFHIGGNQVTAGCSATKSLLCAAHQVSQRWEQLKPLLEAAHQVFP
jgi:hypothetical protein